MLYSIILDGMLKYREYRKYRIILIYPTFSHCSRHSVICTYMHNRGMILLVMQIMLMSNIINQRISAYIRMNSIRIYAYICEHFQACRNSTNVYLPQFTSMQIASHLNIVNVSPGASSLSL